MNRAKRNKMAAAAALHAAHDDGQKAAIAVDDDEKAKAMLAVVITVASKHKFAIGELTYGNGSIIIPVNEGEVRIISADRLLAVNRGLPN